MTDSKKKNVIFKLKTMGGLIYCGGDVVKSKVQWRLLVTALSCLCLYHLLAVEQLSLPEMQLIRASNRLNRNRPPVSLCLNENSRNSNNVCQFQNK